jgi:prepilin-type processing-associated H-X9-DG protein
MTGSNRFCFCLAFSGERKHLLCEWPERRASAKASQSPISRESLMRRNRSIPSRAGGFTLVELLTVIGIIAALIAILLPVLSRARQAAQSLKCAANLRSLGQMLVMHANEHRGYLPLGGNIVPGSDLNGFDDPQSLGDGIRQRYDYYQNTPGYIRVTAIPAALAPYIGSQTIRDDLWSDVEADIGTGPVQEAFLCPSDENTIERNYGAPQWIRNYAGGNGNETYLTGWTSYGFNAEVFGWTDAGVNGTTGHSRARGKLSIIPNPSDTMLMCDSFEAIEIWVLGPQLSLGDVYLGTGGTAGSGVFDLVRHRGTMNILYADGHVDRATILNTAGTTTSAAVGTSGNSPSGDLMNVSMDKNFQ